MDIQQAEETTPVVERRPPAAAPTTPRRQLTNEELDEMVEAYKRRQLKRHPETRDQWDDVCHTPYGTPYGRASLDLRSDPDRRLGVVCD